MSKLSTEVKRDAFMLGAATASLAIAQDIRSICESCLEAGVRENIVERIHNVVTPNVLKKTNPYAEEREKND